MYQEPGFLTGKAVRMQQALATRALAGWFIRSSWLTARLAAALALAVLPASVLARGSGYWHTSGSQILDSRGNSIRIAGISWFGFETTDQVAHGLWNQDYHRILHTIRLSGFNTIRLPYSNQMVEYPAIPPFEKTPDAINNDLTSLTSLQIMDRIISAAGAEGLKVILDNHRSEAGNSNESNGLWYTRDYPESHWIADWQSLAMRYRSFTDPDGNPIVIGMDLRNEPFSMVGNQPTGACWTGDATTGGCPITDIAHNWPAAAGRAATAILNINPRLLIFVEGVDCYSGSCNWQGGNLQGAGAYPVETPFAGHIVYSAHDYGPTECQQPWFKGDTTAASLQERWTRNWAYLVNADMAPVWLGEFGTSNRDADIENSAAGSQGQWFSALMDFLRAQPRISWSYWAVNGEDRAGLLAHNYTALPHSLKLEQLATIQYPLDSSDPVESQVVAAETQDAAPKEPQHHGASGFFAAAATTSCMIGLVMVQRRPRRRKGQNDAADNDDLRPGSGSL